MKKNALLVLLLGLQSIIVMGSDSDITPSEPSEVQRYFVWESPSTRYLKDYDSHIQEERRSFSRDCKLPVNTTFELLQQANQTRLSSYRSGSSTQAASSPIKSSSSVSPLSQSPESLPASAVAVFAASTLPKPVAIIAGFAPYNPSAAAIRSIPMLRNSPESSSVQSSLSSSVAVAAVQQILTPTAISSAQKASLGFQASGAPADRAGYGEFFNSDSDSEESGCCNGCCFRK